MPEFFVELSDFDDYPSDEPQFAITLPANDDDTLVETEFTPHWDRLNSLLFDSRLWPDGAEAPSVNAMEAASLALRMLEHAWVIPDRVVASIEGGIGICFLEGNKYADIEFLNSGEILGVTSDRRSRPSAWEIEQSPSDLLSATERICEFLRRA